MKLSYKWLCEWIDVKVNQDELAKRLTLAGLEVESIYPVAGVFNNVIVAKVLTTTPHPDAQKLTLCEVSTGDKTLQIVCGAPNVRPNLKVALALEGAVLPNGMAIKNAKLRGELSQGMLCSSEELKLEYDDVDGIMELPDDAPIGISLREYLDLDDWILEVDITPNRSDCLSILGIARDVGALYDLELKVKSIAVTEISTENSLSVHLEDGKDGPLYCGRIINNINSASTTPSWMKMKLLRSGIRPIHPVVDVANFVMIELGQPMHAFDLNAIDGDIVVRLAKNNETLELLDGQKINLDDSVLVIADEKTPLALAGIMGGNNSAVTENTTDIFLESAYFNPITISGVARRFGLNSDSSSRFERGIDPNLPALALERATQLLLDIVGGNAGPITFVSEAQHLPEKKKIYFNPERVLKLTGIKIAKDDMLKLFGNLGFKVSVLEESNWLVISPSYRVDINEEVDLIEEIIRLHGYDKLPSKNISNSLNRGSISFVEDTLSQIASFLNARGYSETISYSFVDPELQNVLFPKDNPLVLQNPISKNLSQMRVSLIPGLLASMVYNVHRQQNSFKLFETGTTYHLVNNNCTESLVIGGLITGNPASLNWIQEKRVFDFYDLKGDVEALFDAFNLEDIQYVVNEHPALHPGKTAEVLLAGKSIGWIGAIHPRLKDALDLETEVFVFELSLDAFKESKVHAYKNISKYPKIRRDLSFLLDKNIESKQIESAILEVVSKDLLKSFDVFDVYVGENIPKDKKSIALALTLQDDQRTLIDKDVNDLMEVVIKQLTDKFSIILRDQ